MCAWLSCLYISLGMAAMPHHYAAPPGEWWSYVPNEQANPYGVAEIGWSRAVGPLEWTAAARHMSSLAVDWRYRDFNHNSGINTFEARVTWRPFR